MRGLVGYMHGRDVIAQANAATRRWSTLRLATGVSGASYACPNSEYSLHLYQHSHLHKTRAMSTAAAAAQRADGDGELMTLNGTLPVDLSSGTKYEVPMCVWIPREYPDQPPELYILPTSTGLPEFPHAVAEDGRCEMPYCRS